MRLGDLDQLARWLKAVIASLPIEDKARAGFSECLAKVKSMKEIDEIEPVRHGRWVPTRPSLCSVKCSVCEKSWETETPCCPSCGAKMDLEG